jgi:glycosyltransferase involved in cell wall biosynthesis
MLFALNQPDRARVAVRGAQRIGFLWYSAFKPWERHIYRQVSGSRSFAPVIIYRQLLGSAAALSIPPVHLNATRRRFWRLYMKLRRAPKFVYNRLAKALIDISREHQLQLLHVFFGTKAILCLPALRQLEIPVSVSFHGRDVAECLNEPQFSCHLPGLFERADCIMVRSEFMGNKLIAGGCADSKIWVNWAGIPMQHFPYSPRSRAVGEPITFLQACRLIPKKGVQDTICAFHQVQRSIPSARLWIAGDGELRDNLESMVRRMELTDSVTFLGPLDEEALMQRFHAADVFVHPSITTGTGDQEGIPNSMLEAMATGLAPIVTRHAGIPEVVRNGETGWLVAEASPDQLASRMLWCARHPEEMRSVGVEAHQLVERQFALHRRIDDLDRKYSELIGIRAKARMPTLPDDADDRLRSQCLVE